MASSSNASRTQRFLDAALSGNLKLLKKLALELDYGDGFATTVVSVKDSNGRTALHFAASRGRTHVCKYLIEELKPDVNMKDGKGETPLRHATLGENLPTAIYLSENGAGPNAENDERLTALHYAAEKGLKKFLRLLISEGAVVDAKADSGTPLQYAAAHGKKEAFKILLDNSAIVRKKIITEYSFSSYLFTIGGIYTCQSFECVKLLLQAGADPNIISQGVTALGIAASEGETEMIKCLLHAGADANVTNNYGLTPVEIAALQCNHEAVMILFPVTSRIPTIPDWRVGGIIRHIHSEEAKEDPSDAAVLSNRSLCWARLNEGSHALSDAQACIELRPDWPKAYYREGVAWNLLKQYHQAVESFHDGLKLDPEKKELQTAFGEALEAEMKYMVGNRNPHSMSSSANLVETKHEYIAF